MKIYLSILYFRLPKKGLRQSIEKEFSRNSAVNSVNIFPNFTAVM